MPVPRVARPHFPKGYVDNPRALLSWDAVEQELAKARHYWLCSTRSDGRPHAVPIWGAWSGNRFYFDGSPQTLQARNISQNPHVCLHLESGEHAVILDGTAGQIKPPKELAVRIAKEYSVKYAALGYSPEPDAWDDGGLFEIEPRSVIAWTKFAEDPTKFIFIPHGGKLKRKNEKTAGRKPRRSAPLGIRNKTV